MATTHLKDLAVVSDTYQDNQGNEKKRWKTVGKLLRNQNGDFIVFDRTFNPAGCPGSGDLFISLFEPKQKQQVNSQQRNNYDAPDNRDLSDSIPF